MVMYITMHFAKLQYLTYPTLPVKSWSIQLMANLFPDKSSVSHDKLEIGHKLTGSLYQISQTKIETIFQNKTIHIGKNFRTPVATWFIGNRRVYSERRMKFVSKLSVKYEMR